MKKIVISVLVIGVVAGLALYLPRVLKQEQPPPEEIAQEQEETTNNQIPEPTTTPAAAPEPTPVAPPPASNPQPAPQPTPPPPQQPAPAPQPTPTPAPEPTPPQPTPPPPTPPQPSTEQFTIGATDYGFSQGGQSISSLSVTKDNTVKITFQVSSTQVYYGGLDFRGCGVNTPTIPPGGSTSVQFTAGSTCTITSYWPTSGVVKANLLINIQ